MHNTIQDFTAFELGQIASQEFALRGPNQMVSCLVFSTLEKDPYQPDALLIFSQFLDFIQKEQLAAVVLEYALAVDNPIPFEAQKELDNLRFLLKWKWGFAQHKTSQNTLLRRDFLNRKMFDVNEMRYWTFFSPIVNSAGSLEAAYQKIHNTHGKELGFLHLAPEESALYGEQTNTFTQDWEAWLAEPAEKLEVITQEFDFRKNELRAQKEAKVFAQKQQEANEAYNREFYALIFLSLFNALGAYLYFFANETDVSAFPFSLFLIAAATYFVIGLFVKKGVIWFYPIAIVLMMLQGMALILYAAERMSDFFFWIVSIFVAAVWINRFYNLDLFVFKRQRKLGYREKSWFGVGLILFGAVFLAALAVRYG